MAEKRDGKGRGGKVEKTRQEVRGGGREEKGGARPPDI